VAKIKNRLPAPCDPTTVLQREYNQAATGPAPAGEAKVTMPQRHCPASPGRPASAANGGFGSAFVAE